MDKKELDKKKINNISLLIVAICVLVLAVLGAGYYIYHQKQQLAGLTATFDIEKEGMADELNELSLQYEGYKFSVGNDSLVSLLSTEQSKVQRLMEELRTTKATNSKRISELKKEISTLRKIMRNYVIQIDSLNNENEKLKKTNIKVVRQYQVATNRAVVLKKEKEKLSERVTLASRLDAVGISVTPVNDRGKKQKHIKNITAPVGEKVLFVRIIKPNDDILIKSLGHLFTYEDQEISYSMKKMIEYDGGEQEVIMYWDIEEFLLPGEYRIDIFADGNLIGKKTFYLKN
ncbi:MAG: hypothetical protein M0P33_10820 [Massilibacteroides sp.]|nr:hypothetical protein [Massilibacteroides sp.]